jgi:hypothetical protein
MLHALACWSGLLFATGRDRCGGHSFADCPAATASRLSQTGVSALTPNSCHDLAGLERRLLAFQRRYQHEWFPAAA